MGPGEARYAGGVRGAVNVGVVVSGDSFIRERAWVACLVPAGVVRARITALTDAIIIIRQNWRSKRREKTNRGVHGPRDRCICVNNLTEEGV